MSEFDFAPVPKVSYIHHGQVVPYLLHMPRTSLDLSSSAIPCRFTSV